MNRKDKYPDALAVAGGDPRLAGVSGVTAGETVPTAPRSAITYAQAQQTVFRRSAGPCRRCAATPSTSSMPTPKAVSTRAPRLTPVTRPTPTCLAPARAAQRGW